MTDLARYRVGALPGAKRADAPYGGPGLVIGYGNLRSGREHEAIELLARAIG